MKQEEQIRARIDEDLREMDKPLARSADDQDLEEHLRKQEREEDPMLEYMRKKKKAKMIAAGAKGRGYCTYFILWIQNFT